MNSKKKKELTEEAGMAIVIAALVLVFAIWLKSAKADEDYLRANDARVAGKIERLGGTGQ